MTNIINLFYFSSSEAIVNELSAKLKHGELNSNLVFLDEKKTITIEGNFSEACLNVLILRQVDMEAIKGIRWEGFPQWVYINKDQGLNVAFCINCAMAAPQLADCFMLKRVEDSAELIRREIVQFYSQLFQTSKGRYGFFVGRNSEREQFQNLLYSEKASRINALIVSGRPGIGREAYVRECIREAKGDSNYEPLLLSMGNNGDIELFLVQLNSICHTYTEDAFIELLNRSTEEKVEAAIIMLNYLYRNDDYLLLYDDGAACIRYNRNLSDWFKRVVTHPMLKGGIRFFVISNISVSYSHIKADESLAYITLYGLTFSDRKKILYKRLSLFHIALPEDVVLFLVDKLVYSPSQLMRVAEDIQNKGFKYVKENISNYQIVGDRKILTVINSYLQSGYFEARNILVLLSRIEYVSNKILTTVFSDYLDDVRGAIDMFMADGIVERFGEWMDLIRLDSSISDYIRRNKMGYSEIGLQDLVKDKLSELIEDTHYITEDYAAFLEKLKIGVRKGRIDEEAYLLPSIIVNTITENYDKRQWGKTIMLCESVLDRHPDYFDDVYKEINYWYCLALARKQIRDKFYQNVGQFSGSDLHFLKGFYLRIEKQYAKAEDEYRKSLKDNPSSQRAKRELVLVLQAQHKFKDALETAELNYEKDKENAYHIHAYFRCLVRKNGLTAEERSLLREFIEDPNNLFKSKRFFIDGMKFEYQRFVDKMKPDRLFPIANDLLKRYKGIAYIMDVTGDYFVSQGMQPHLRPIDFSEDFNL